MNKLSVRFKFKFIFITISVPLLTSILTVISYTDAILAGYNVNISDSSKGYMVYFIKAKESPRLYDAWVCGGCIITPKHVLTSAACLEDVEKMYAIAETVKYVKYEDLDEDPCTKASKKKVVKTCVPRGYAFDYDKVESWSNIDIGAAEVESEFNFAVKSHDTCTYKPVILAINYNSKWQSDGTDAFVMGWGHNLTWRQIDETWDGNSNNLKVTHVKIVAKKECIESYKNWVQKKVDLEPIITKYMICSNGNGAMDSHGDFNDDDKEKPLLEDGCLLRAPDGKCLRYKKGKKAEVEPRQRNEVTAGICQNDHGGPLVTYVGGHQKVLAVASVFHVDPMRHYLCHGPFLYTSTHCNQNFLKCLMLNYTAKGRSGPEDDPSIFYGENGEENRKFNYDVCHLPPALRGFTIVEKTINWSGFHSSTSNKSKNPMRQKIKPIGRQPGKRKKRVRRPGRHPRRPFRKPLRKPAGRNASKQLRKPKLKKKFFIREQIPLGNLGQMPKKKL